jgi:AcrR family transcriptional regulator
MATSKTRERIIDAAMELFALRGYGNTGLTEIAKKADAQPGSLYHFFPSKEDLLRATLQRRIETLWSDVLTPVWDGVDDPLERIFKLLDGYRRMLLVTEFSHGCPIGNLAIEIAETHPRTRPLIAANFDNWLRAVEQCVRDAAARLPSGVDASRLAIFVLTTMEGAVMLARARGSLAPFDEAVATLREHFRLLERAAG